ncbi:MAG: hypothetical protein GY936_12780, partial [Ignavibacteriae bacterium]|nr:hypothetical protein [Ignavibacteriota bacterium]
KGTYHEESSGKATGQNIPFLSQTFDDLVNNLQLSKSEVQNKFHTVRAKLFDVRKKKFILTKMIKFSQIGMD